MDLLDRDLRGAPHGPDHVIFADVRRLVVTSGRDGYAYAAADGTYLLAARTEPTATRLLWECLAGADGHFEVSHVTSANMWAADVALRAKLAMGTRGFLGVRGMAQPAPYIHCGPLLLAGPGTGAVPAAYLLCHGILDGITGAWMRFSHVSGGRPSRPGPGRRPAGRRRSSLQPLRASRPARPAGRITPKTFHIP